MLSQRKTIFVVDDEPDIVELITYNLEREGYKALGFTQGERHSKKLPSCSQTLSSSTL